MFALLAVSACEPVAAAPVILGPTAYLAFDNTLPGAGTAASPFKDLTFSYIHLETFEDHLLNEPGVSASAGGVTSVVFGPSIHDSIDADDGVIDGSGLKGDDVFSPAGASGITFTFSTAVLGQLPTHVGIVWTDGAGRVTFGAFGLSGLLRGFGPGTGLGFPNASVNGESAEDRFFGVIDRDGIASISISNSSGGIDIDHLQYGLAAPVPTPAALYLRAAGLCTLGARRRVRLCSTQQVTADRYTDRARPHRCVRCGHGSTRRQPLLAGWQWHVGKPRAQRRGSSGSCGAQRGF